MKSVLLPRLPWWLWAGWVVHLVAYALPSYQMTGQETASGLKCADIAWQMWFSEDGLWRELKAGNSDAIRGMAMIGWFNVTNLMAILAPWLVGRSRRPALAWWTALLCATGALQAVAFGFGMFTGERQFESLRLGYYVWLASYVWLAVGAAVVWRRVRVTPVLPKAESALALP